MFFYDELDADMIVVSAIYRRGNILKKKLAELEVQAGESDPSLSVTSYFNAHDLDDLQHRRSSLANVKLDSTRDISQDVGIVSNAIKSEQTLNMDQIESFRHLIMWEIDSMTEEMAGSCLVTNNHYPNNLTVADFLSFIPLPTLIYELEYPRQENINWVYVVEKIAATFGVIFVMIGISQAWIYPVVIQTLEMKKRGLTVQQRLNEFPWVLGDLLFPFLMEYLLSFYVIWECIVSEPS
jgi:sterol O-acyltransferase